MSSSDEDEDGSVGFLFAGSREEPPPQQCYDDDPEYDGYDDDEPSPQAAPQQRTVRFSDQTAAPARHGGAPAGQGEGFSFEGFGQMKDLTMQNAQLHAELERYKNEVQQLREEVADAPAGSSDLAANKIKELAKKNRGLNLMLEREKTKVSKLERELVDEKKNAKAKKGGKPAGKGGPQDQAASAGAKGAKGTKEDAVPVGPEEEIAKLRAELRDWKEKYAQANVKVTEMRSEVQATRNETKKMQRALQREVGEEVPLAKVLAEDGSWKGRAEQLSILQSKLKQMKRQLDNATEAGSEPPTSPRPAKGIDLDERHEKHIEQKQRERQRDVDAVMGELAKREEELADAKTKHSAATARTRTLEEEVRKLKEKLRVCLDKADNDDLFIAAMKGELESALQREGDLKSLLAEQTSKPANASPKLGPAPDSEQERFTVGQRNKMHEEHQAAIQAIRDENRALQAELSTKQRQLQKVNADMAQTKTMLRSHNDLIMSSKLKEVEIEKVKEFSELLQKDLGQADTEQNSLEAALQEEREKTVALERQLGKRGLDKKQVAAATGDLAAVRREASESIAAAQREGDDAKKERVLQEEIFARQRSVYEAGLREMMRLMQLRASAPNSTKVEELITENDTLRSEVADLRARMRA